MLTNISNSIAAHSAFLGLLALAFVVTMRESLPPPFDSVPAFVWLYGWLHDALKTFVSLRGPKSDGK